ncbi:MAG: D-alanyl-D-alanine carboxypeptidase/D-alanyl-D-alanine-endopeptidase [Paludibacter sp.]|nr:D-alanyl-D-alanine carboxypeptidase/D-alanyl-D-alanine-endopeptidase [Paludibacter sp.]
MKRLLLPTFLFLFSVGLMAQSALADFVQNPLLNNANISLLVKDLKSNKSLYSYRANNSAVPASTMKLVTTATALEMFGPDFRFSTTLEMDGELKDGVLNGNLIIRGGGDPTLGSAKMGDQDFMNKWVQAVKSAGIKKINGRIIANTSVFDQQVVNPRWIWEDMGNYYAPGIHGISYLDNTFRLILKSGKVGTPTEIVRAEPEIAGMSFQNYVMSASIGYDNAYFYGEPFSGSRTLFGEIPANKDEFAVKGDIPNPGLLLAQHFHAALLEAGFGISEFPLIDLFNTKAAKVIYTHQSAPLSEIITETNVKSNNHFAEYLFKYLATTKAIPATNKSAVSVIESFWRQRALSVNQLFMNDGSGLSPNNGVSAAFFVNLLTYMRKESKYAEVFQKSLAVSGKSGTLTSFLAKSNLKGKVFAKSGTLAQVKSYAGYVETGSTTLAFAIIVNNPNGSSSEVVKKMEQFLIDISK